MLKNTLLDIIDLTGCKDILTEIIDAENKQYTLISSIVYFDTKSKIHVAKENETVGTLCGYNLGFNFEPQKIDGSSEVEKYSKKDILNCISICKKCLNKLK